MTREMISRVRRKIADADSAFRLRAEFSKTLQRDYQKIIRSLSKRRGITLDRLNGHEDMLVENLNLKKDALLLANAGGTDTFSILALLSFLGSSHLSNYNIYAIPNRTPIHRNTKNATVFNARLANEFGGRHLALAIVMKDGLPYFDSFYVAVSSNRRKVGRERDLVKHLESKGHKLGAFSYSEDTSKYTVIKTENSMLQGLQSLGADVYGFTVNEEIETCVDAMKFLLN